MNKKTTEQIKELLTANEFDPKAGAQIYLVNGRNSNMANIFMRSPERNAGKIRWELAKMIGISLAEYQKMINPETSLAEKGSFIPQVIDRIKLELEKLYPIRVGIQKNITELPESNDDETKAKALELGEAADVLAMRYQELMDAKELFFEDGTVPDEKALFPEEPNADADAETKDAGTRDEEDPYGLESKDPIWIMKRRDNLISSLSKDRNMVKFQAKTAQPTENPMPAGEERKKVEERIAVKEAELEAINKFLDKKDAGKE
jgi:hypothetical protein